MKKNKIIIILLAISVLFIIIGLLINYNNDNNANNEILDSNQNNTNNSQEEKLTISVDEEYTCLMSTTPSNGENKYNLETYYHFWVISGEVKNGRLEKRYIFNDKASYDNFKYDSNSFSIESYDNKFNEINLTKSYFYFLQLVGSTNDVSKYLTEMQEKNYICEKVSIN